MQGCTALHIAAATDQHETLRLLLAFGADMGAVDHLVRLFGVLCLLKLTRVSSCIPPAFPLHNLPVYVAWELSCSDYRCSALLQCSACLCAAHPVVCLVLCRSHEAIMLMGKLYLHTGKAWVVKPAASNLRLLCYRGKQLFIMQQPPVLLPDFTSHTTWTKRQASSTQR